MYFDLREILKIEKEGINKAHKQVDIRDYFELRSGKVIGFTSFQKFYIQEHFNIIFDLNQRDTDEYVKHKEINGNIFDFENLDPIGAPRKCDFIEEELTKREWIEGWTAFSLENKVLSISSGPAFRKFVHTFEVTRYGYVIPELIYRFAVLEGRETKLQVDTTKGDTFALQSWRDTVAAAATGLEDLSSSVGQLIRSVFKYFEETQPEDVNKNFRPDFEEIRPKSVWECSARFVKSLQTGRDKYSPSKPYQRVHYENTDEGTQTDVLGGHFGQILEENLTNWPYFGERDWNGSIIGARVFTWSRKRKREGEGEEVRQDPRRVPDRGDLNGWDTRKN